VCSTAQCERGFCAWLVCGGAGHIRCEGEGPGGYASIYRSCLCRKCSRKGLVCLCACRMVLVCSAAQCERGFCAWLVCGGAGHINCEGEGPGGYVSIYRSCLCRKCSGKGLVCLYTCRMVFVCSVAQCERGLRAWLVCGCVLAQGTCAGEGPGRCVCL